MFQKSAWHHPGYRTHACRVMGLEGNSSICARLECGKASLDSALLLACASGSSGSAETIQALPGVQNSCYRGSRLLDGQCERDQYPDVGNSIKQVTRGGAWNASSGCRPLVCPRQVCARPEPLPQRRAAGLGMGFGRGASMGGSEGFSMMGCPAEPPLACRMDALKSRTPVRRHHKLLSF